MTRENFRLMQLLLMKATEVYLVLHAVVHGEVSRPLIFALISSILINGSNGLADQLICLFRLHPDSLQIIANFYIFWKLITLRLTLTDVTEDELGLLR